MAKKLSTKIDDIYKDLALVPKKMIEQAGEKAMDIIADYPLYASGLSNITYEEAIAIALVLRKDF